AFYFKYKANEFDALFPKIKIGEFKELPIKKLSSEKQHLLVKHAQLQTALKKELQEFIDKFQAEIYQQYSLNSSKKLQIWHQLEPVEFIGEVNKAIKISNKKREIEGTQPVAILPEDDKELLKFFEENKNTAIG